MVMTGNWFVLNCRREPSLRWDLYHVPRGPKGRFTRTTCEGIGMSAASHHKAEAWEWIRFVLGAEGQAIIARSERGMPAVRRVAERVYPNPRTPQREERFLEAMAYARSQRIPVQFAENDAVALREWDLLLLGRRRPEEAAAIMTREINQIMAEPR